MPCTSLGDIFRDPCHPQFCEREKHMSRMQPIEPNILSCRRQGHDPIVDGCPSEEDRSHCSRKSTSNTDCLCGWSCMMLVAECAVALRDRSTGRHEVHPASLQCALWELRCGCAPALSSDRLDFDLAILSANLGCRTMYSVLGPRCQFLARCACAPATSACFNQFPSVN
jgi:hypothetical protein